MLVSYAQNREDMFLYALLGDGPGFYVDIGANHPTKDSVTRFFYERGWHGINIEPNGDLVAELAIARPRDVNLKLGISDSAGSMTLRVFNAADGLSTFDPDLMHRHESAYPVFEDRCVAVATLASVLADHSVGVIDFMKIDTEGHEMHVLEGNDWSVFRPRCLVIEGGLHDSYIPYLADRGYSKEFFDGLNFYFVASECAQEITIMKYAERVLSQAVVPGAIAEQVAALEAQLAGTANVDRGSSDDAHSAGAQTSIGAVEEQREENRHGVAARANERLRRWLGRGRWRGFIQRFRVTRR